MATADAPSWPSVEQGSRLDIDMLDDASTFGDEDDGINREQLQEIKARTM